MPLSKYQTVKCVMLTGMVLLTACATTPTTVVNVPGSTEAVSPYANQGETTLGLDYRDFQFASERAIESFLASPLSDKPNSEAPWIMAIGRIINDTTLNIDTSQLVKKIRIELLNSGRVVVTTAVGAGGAEESMVSDVRKLSESELFNQDTVAKQGTVIAPELSLSGKIIQRINIVNKKQQVEYYFQLSMTNLENGLAYWEFEEVLAKQGSNKSHTW